MCDVPGSFSLGHLKLSYLIHVMRVPHNTAIFRNSFCGSIMLFLSCFCYASIDALRSPAGKGLISWLSFVMSNCEFVTFPLVSWVTFGA